MQILSPHGWHIECLDSTSGVGLSWVGALREVLILYWGGGGVEGGWTAAAGQDELNGSCGTLLFSPSLPSSSAPPPLLPSACPLILPPPPLLLSHLSSPSLWVPGLTSTWWKPSWPHTQTKINTYIRYIYTYRGCHSDQLWIAASLLSLGGMCSWNNYATAQLSRDLFSCALSLPVSQGEEGQAWSERRRGSNWWSLK